MSWFQIWTVGWQVSVFLTPLLLSVAILWLKSQFVTKSDAKSETNRVDARIDTVRTGFDAHVSRLDDHRYDHEARLKIVEEYVNRPSSQHKLATAVASVQGELNEWRRYVEQLARAMETRAGEQNRQFDTLNNYLHTLVEKGLR